VGPCSHSAAGTWVPRERRLRMIRGCLPPGGVKRHRYWAVPSGKRPLPGRGASWRRP
jgi:hypothetical protein